MPAATDQREPIIAALRDFDKLPLADAARNLFSTLGYKSDRSLNLGDSKPKTFLDFVRSSNAGSSFDEKKSLFSEWKSADLLFQLTGDDIGNERGLFDSGKVDASNMKSYIFFAISLTGKDYSRGSFANIARQINRIFPMPVMVLIAYDKKFTIAIINRRQDKRKYLDRDVLEKGVFSKSKCKYS